MESTKKPLSAKHERFCQLIASTSTGTEAYIQAGHKVGRVTAAASAYKLLRKDQIKARIAELKEITAAKAEFTRDDMVRWLVSGMTTPVDAIHGGHPLSQEKSEVIEVRPGKGGKKETVVKRRVKSVGKTECARMLMEMMGWKSPVELVVETGPKMLDVIRDRAERMVSALDMVAEKRRENQPASHGRN
jgi:hypothetical protein